MPGITPPVPLPPYARLPRPHAPPRGPSPILPCIIIIFILYKLVGVGAGMGYVGGVWGWGPGAWYPLCWYCMATGPGPPPFPPPMPYTLSPLAPPVPRPGTPPYPLREMSPP